MILLPQWKPLVFRISYFSCSFSSQNCYFCSLLPRPAQGTLKPLKQVYNPTKTAPISESWSGLVTVFGTGQKQLRAVIWQTQQTQRNLCKLCIVAVDPVKNSRQKIVVKNYANIRHHTWKNKPSTLRRDLIMEFMQAVHRCWRAT